MDNENEKLVEGDDENKKEELGNKVDTKIQKKDEKGVKKDSEAKLIFMKKGSYTVHILILEVKNLEVKDPDVGACPVIKMTVLGDSKRTAKVNNTQNYFYGEHFYFEKSNMTPEQLDTEKIVFEIYDYNFPERKDFLAIYETDFQNIYSKPKHSIQNLWFAMANPESDDFSKIRGYLRLSISVLNEKDDRVELNVERNDKSNSILIMPPQIRIKHKQLKIHFLEAQELPDMDSLLNTFKNKQFKECDAYVSIEFMGLTLNTSISVMKKNIAKWSETIYIPIIFPVVSHKIKMCVWDKDPGSSEIIGSYEIDVDKVLENGYNNWQFIHIYGSPLNTIGKYTKKMNKYPEIGSMWKGKIFMKIEFEDDPHVTITEVRTMDPNIEKEGYLNIEKSVFWTINFVLHEAFFLPSDDCYKIKVCAENNCGSSMEIPARDNYINFNGFKGSIKGQSSIDDPNNMGDLFIYLEYKGKNICFQRFKCGMFHNKTDIMMVKLLPDFAIGTVNESRKAGILKIEINLKKSDFFALDQDLNSSFNSEKNILQIADPEIQIKNIVYNLNLKNYYVVANIYQSRYLIAGDSDGTSDPYIKIKVGKQKLKTTVKNDTVNPIWNEILVFENIYLDYDDPTTWPIFYLECLDSDFVEITDDCLGYSYIWLTDTNHYFNNLKQEFKPRWEQLYLPVSNRPQGQLLMSFLIIEKDRFPNVEMLKKEINIVPEIKNYTFEMNILGLRDLQPLSLIPVKKPFIIFDVNSINFNIGEKSLKEQKKDEKTSDLQNYTIKTQPKESGSDPNINIVLKFDVNLPSQELYLPNLQCMVNDSMLAGFINQLLGIFIIPIKEIFRAHQVKLEEDLNTLRKNTIKYKCDIKAKKAYTLKEKSDKDQNFLIESKKNSVLDIGKFIAPEDKKPLLAKAKQEKSLPTENFSRQSSIKSMVYNEVDEVDEKLQIIKRPIYKKYTLPGIKEFSPNYKEYDIEDEFQRPPRDSWMEVGFNKGIEDNKRYKKHFRRKYMCELENAKVYDMISPFNTYFIKRGKFEDKREKSQIFEAIRNPNNKIFKYVKRTETMSEEEKKKEEERINELNKSNDSQKMLDDKVNTLITKSFGCFKGLIRILEKDKVDACNKMINKLTAIGKFNYEDYPYLNQNNLLSKELLCPKDVVVRIYILEFNNIKQKDLMSPSDPFLVIKLGDQKINDEANYKEDMIDMKVYRRFDINAKLPGPSKLTIELYDHDFLFSNEFIGSTVIDIEDRFYDKNWNKLKHKPIEVRKLRDPDMPGVQAEVSLWIEIFEKSLRDSTPAWDVKPAPEIEMELRIVIWETKDIPFADIEETSDIYVKVFIDENTKKSTDIHYRCQTGCGSFNYRIIIPVKYPSNTTTLKIQVYDNDLLSSDDFICGTDMDLKRMISDLYYLDVPMTFDKFYFDDLVNSTPELKDHIDFPDKSQKNDFWVKMFKMEGTDKKQIGEVKMSLEILPIWRAELCKVGEGRNEPNINPYLPPPTGRFEWSINPFKMFNQLVGPGIRTKLYCACCVICILLFLIIIIPYIALNLIAQYLNPFNYKTTTPTKLFLT